MARRRALRRAATLFDAKRRVDHAAQRRVAGRRRRVPPSAPARAPAAAKAAPAAPAAAARAHRAGPGRRLRARVARRHAGRSLRLLGRAFGQRREVRRPVERQGQDRPALFPRHARFHFRERAGRRGRAADPRGAEPPPPDDRVHRAARECARRGGGPDALLLFDEKGRQRLDGQHVPRQPGAHRPDRRAGAVSGGPRRRRRARGLGRRRRVFGPRVRVAVVLRRGYRRRARAGRQRRVRASISSPPPGLHFYFADVLSFPLSGTCARP